MTYDHNGTQECHLWRDNPDRCTVVLTVQRISSALSVLGCLAVLILIITLKKYRESILPKLIFWLAMSGLLRSLALLLKNMHENKFHYCRFKAFFHFYFSWAMLLWVFMITINCLLIVKRKPYETYYKWYHFAVWFGSLFWSVIPFLKDSYGQAGIWCWIKRETDVRFGLWYGPLFALCFIMFTIYIYLLWFVIRLKRAISNRATEEEVSLETMRRKLMQLLSYPLIYALFSIPIFIYRIDDALSPEDIRNYPLAIATAILTPSLGAVYAVAFIIINATLREISIPLMREGIRDLFRSSQRLVIHPNVEVGSVHFSRATASKYQEFED